MQKKNIDSKTLMTSFSLGQRKYSNSEFFDVITH